VPNPARATNTMPNSFRCGMLLRLDDLFLGFLKNVVLSCLYRLYTPRAGRALPAGGGGLRCWFAAPPPLPQTWTCCAVQIVTRGRPSSPFALSGSSVGQRGIFAQTTQLLAPAKQTISVS
jgi:hypothetical protein